MNLRTTKHPHSPSPDSPTKQAKHDDSDDPHHSSESSGKKGKEKEISHTIQPGLRSYFDMKLTDRINSEVLQLSDPGKARYSISNIPSCSDWGPKAGGADDKSSYLCYEGKKIRILFASEIDFRWFSKGPYNHHHPGIRHFPLLHSDLQLGQNTINNYSKPQGNRKPEGSMIAMKYMGSKDNLETMKPFVNVFDVSSEFSREDAIQPNELKKNDVVAVEVFLHRFKAQTDKSNTWSTWTAQYELAAVYRYLIPPSDD